MALKPALFDFSLKNILKETVQNVDGEQNFKKKIKNPSYPFLIFQFFWENHFWEQANNQNLDEQIFDGYFKKLCVAYVEMLKNYQFKIGGNNSHSY